MPISSECKKSAAMQGAKLCPQASCSSSALSNSYLHALCNCLPPFNKFKIHGICINQPGTAVPIPQRGCMCCCGCVAQGTPIAYAKNNYKSVEDYQVGEKVYVANNANLTSWSYKEIGFSSGPGIEGNQTLLLMVVFINPDGKLDFLYCTRDQPFLVAGHKLKAANKLVPGRDQLLRYDNTKSTVVALKLGEFKRGVHHIATSNKPATTMGGHLLVSKGIVIADYALQIAEISKIEDTTQVTVENHENLPEFGTEIYNLSYPELIGDLFEVEIKEMQEILAKNKDLKNDSFQSLASKESLKIPKEIHYFITEKQAKDLQKAPAYPIGNPTTHKMINHIFAQMQGFYPSVKFHIAPTKIIPNAHSFRDDQGPHVVVNEGLLRLKDMRYELLVFIVAHELGHLFGDNPKNINGYSCTGQADYAAITAVIPLVWWGFSGHPIIKAALKQVQKIFKYISKENRKGTAGDTCIDIPLSCRIKSMKNAIAIQPLPPCAGGEKQS